MKNGFFLTVVLAAVTLSTNTQAGAIFDRLNPLSKPLVEDSPKVEPIRYALLKAEVHRYSYVNHEDGYEFKDDIVCRLDVQVPVYDNRGQESPPLSSMEPARCSTELTDFGPVKVNLFSSISLERGEIFQGEPAGDLKGFMTFVWVSKDDGTLLPQPQSQANFAGTRDLGLKSLAIAIGGVDSSVEHDGNRPQDTFLTVIEYVDQDASQQVRP